METKHFVFKGEDFISRDSVFRMFENKLTPHIYDNWDSLYDWITDLSWIKEKHIIIEIVNFDLALTSYPKEKDIFETCLKDANNYWQLNANEFLVNEKKLVEIILHR